MNDPGELGPILGNETCKHETVTLYNGVEGVYAVCHACFGHFWDAAVPDGAEVIDLMTYDTGEDLPEECVHGTTRDKVCADCEALTARYFAHMNGTDDPGGAR